jgi:hypothetical protein
MVLKYVTIDDNLHCRLWESEVNLFNDECDIVR